MKITYFGGGLALLLGLTICGCSEFGHNSMNLSKAKTTFGTPMHYRYGPNDQTNANFFYNAYTNASTPEAQKLVRNQIIYEVMDVIDWDFNRFEKHLRSDYAYKETITKLVSLGLTGAASLTSKDTANILAAIDTGLKGANDAVNLEAWANDAPEILDNQMISSREAIRAEIYSNMVESVTNYPLDQAILDLGHFYTAASVTDALRALNTTTGQSATSAKGQANAAKTTLTKGGSGSTAPGGSTTGGGTGSTSTVTPGSNPASPPTSNGTNAPPQ